MFKINEEQLEILRNKQGYISDMDGVIYHGNCILPGVKEFVDWLYKEDKPFLFLTEVLLFYAVQSRVCPLCFGSTEKRNKKTTGKP